MHGKLATIDGKLTTVGSFNLNYTGYQQNLEMNVDIDSTEFTNALNLKIENWITEACERINETEHAANTLFESFAQFFFYTILSLVADFSIALTARSAKD